MQVVSKRLASQKKHRHSVSEVVGRLARIKKIRYSVTYGDMVGTAITRLADDVVTLDETEHLLIEFKRRRLISGRKMLLMIGRHMKEQDARGKTV